MTIQILSEYLIPDIYNIVKGYLSDPLYLLKKQLLNCNVIRFREYCYILNGNYGIRQLGVRNLTTMGARINYTQYSYFIGYKNDSDNAFDGILHNDTPSSYII